MIQWFDVCGWVHVSFFVAMEDAVSVTVSFEHWWWTDAACRSDGGFACSFVGVGFELLRLLWAAALEKGVRLEV